ncbi:hypothetical protein L9F63_014590, partial [Diploptera punctata]
DIFHRLQTYSGEREISKITLNGADVTSDAVKNEIKNIDIEEEITHNLVHGPIKLQQKIWRLRLASRQPLTKAHSPEIFFKIIIATPAVKSSLVVDTGSLKLKNAVELRLTTSSCDSVDLVPVDNLNTNSRLIHKGNDKFLRERKH